MVFRSSWNYLGYRKYLSRRPGRPSKGLEKSEDIRLRSSPMRWSRCWRKGMARPTTIRIPDELLDEIDQYVKELKIESQKPPFECWIRRLAGFGGTTPGLK